MKELLLQCELRENAKGDKGETARVMRRMGEALQLNGQFAEASKMLEEAEKMRKEMQKQRQWQPEHTNQAWDTYDLLVWNEFW